MKRTILILAVLAAVVPAAASASFVTRNGTQLSLDGHPYKFKGVNDWNANTRPGNGACGYQPNFDQDLTDMHTGAVRSWFVQRMATTRTGGRDWTAFDQTLAAARAHHTKVIAVLADQWDWCESTLKSASWYRSGYKTTVLPRDRVAYRLWVREVAARYRNDDTVLAWELVNEPDVYCPEDAPQVLRRFAVDVSGQIKSVDPNHLVSLGVGGGSGCAFGYGFYSYVLSAPGVDLCTYHDYDFRAVPLPGDADNGLEAQNRACNALGKPLMIDESGILLSDSGNSAQTRADRFAAKIKAAVGIGVVGYLPWAWNDAAHGGTMDDWGIGPGDPLLQVLAG